MKSWYVPFLRRAPALGQPQPLPPHFSPILQLLIAYHRSPPVPSPPFHATATRPWLGVSWDPVKEEKYS